MDLYEKIGEEFISQAIREFYKRVFVDPMIGYFFFKSDQEQLIQKQILFVCSMLGSTEHSYSGLPLQKAHGSLNIRPAHFMRRQQILKEVLADLDLAENLSAEWLKREKKLKSLIVKASSCES